MNNKTCQCECKNYDNCNKNKDYSWNPSTCICENDKYLNSIADNSVIQCDQTITVMDIISTKNTNPTANKYYNYSFNKLPH